jgi:hypothetical protein
MADIIEVVMHGSLRPQLEQWLMEHGFVLERMPPELQKDEAELEGFFVIPRIVRVTSPNGE